MSIRKDNAVLGNIYQMINEGVEGQTIDINKYFDPSKIPSQYGKLLPYIVEFSDRDNQVVNISPILAVGDERVRGLGHYSILTSGGYTYEQGQFNELTLNDFERRKGLIPKIQALVPEFGRSGKEGKVVGPNNTVERNAQAYGF